MVEYEQDSQACITRARNTAATPLPASPPGQALYFFIARDKEEKEGERGQAPLETAPAWTSSHKSLLLHPVGSVLDKARPRPEAAAGVDSLAPQGNEKC